MISPYLVNERSKLVVQGLDLFFLLLPHNLDLGVNLQIKGCQQAMVDGHFVDSSTLAAAIATAESSSTAEPGSTTEPSSTAEPRSTADAIKRTAASARPATGHAIGNALSHGAHIRQARAAPVSWSSEA